MLLASSWQPVSFCGFHTCDFCYSDEDLVKMETIGGEWVSDQSLFIPGSGTVYVCPGGIVHYIRKHRYMPPAEFLNAVADCPPMGTRAYFDALRAQGGGPLVDGTCFEQSTDWHSE